jgi:hypothetical protein
MEPRVTSNKQGLVLGVVGPKALAESLCLSSFDPQSGFAKATPDRSAIRNSFIGEQP